MTTATEYAQLSLAVYKTQDLVNKIELPSGWELAEPLHPDNAGGFSYGAARRATAQSGSEERALVR